MTTARSARSLAELIKKFLVEHLRDDQGRSDNTIESYATTLKLLLRYSCSVRKLSLATLKLSDWTAPTIRDFLRSLESSRGNAPRTRNQRRAALRSFFRFVGAMEPVAMLQVQQVLSIPKKRFDEPIIEYLSPDELEAVLQATGGPSWCGERDRAMLETAYLTGARVSEFTGMNRDDIDLRPKCGEIQITGKGRKQRIVVLTPEATRMLRAWVTRLPPGPSPLFPGKDGKRLTRSGAAARVIRAVKRAARTCTSLAGRSISPHVLRHTTAMHLLENDVSLAEIALYLGHERLETTDKYVVASAALKQRTLDKLPGLGPRRRVSRERQEELFAYLEAIQRTGRPPSTLNSPSANAGRLVMGHLMAARQVGPRADAASTALLTVRPARRR